MNLAGFETVILGGGPGIPGIVRQVQSGVRPPDLFERRMKTRGDQLPTDSRL
jgi:hypothetical protein